MMTVFKPAFGCLAALGLAVAATPAAAQDTAPLPFNFSDFNSDNAPGQLRLVEHSLSPAITSGISAKAFAAQIEDAGATCQSKRGSDGDETCTYHGVGIFAGDSFVEVDWRVGVRIDNTGDVAGVTVRRDYIPN